MLTNYPKGDGAGPKGADTAQRGHCVLLVKNKKLNIVSSEAPKNP